MRKWKVIISLLFYYINIILSIRRIDNNIINNNNSNNNSNYENNNENNENNENINITRRLNIINKNDHLVDKLPLFDNNNDNNNNLLKSYAGHLYVDSDHSALFYWLFEKLVDSNTAPLIIWMNGGPGCSSMDGLFIELGPLKFNSNKLLSLNEHSWHKLGNLLFIDQPVGTGLSFTTKGKYPRNDEEVNIHLYKMLLEFFQLHDNYVTTNEKNQKITRDIYFTGESHAGHYIPSITKYIIEQNSKSSIKINVVGIAIGNGWMDPYNQYDVSDFMHSLGVISLGQKYHMKQRERACQVAIKKGQYRTNICLSLLDDLLDSTGNANTGKLIMYDSRITSKTSSYPPGHEDIENYLNRKDVRNALHVIAPQKYQECTDPPYLALAHQDAKGVTNELAFLLNSNLRVLLYSGQFDVICNHLGIEKMLNKLVWNGRSEWLHSKTGIWAVNNLPAGYYRNANNLHYLIITNAGHMVPLSKPAESLDMMDRFINKKPFAISIPKSTIGTVMPPDELITNDYNSPKPRRKLRRNVQEINESKNLTNLK